jgi:hypothetical protein
MKNDMGTLTSTGPIQKPLPSLACDLVVGIVITLAWLIISVAMSLFTFRLWKVDIKIDVNRLTSK